MKLHFVPLSLILLTGLFLATSHVHALTGGVLARQVDEVIQFFAREFGGEMGEAGGKKAVREAVEAAAKRHGDESLALFRRLGPHAAKVTHRHGDEAFGILRRHGDEGLALLRHSGDEVVPLVRKYGDDAAGLCIRCPGGGQTVLRELGADGLHVASGLPPDDVTKLAYLIPKLRGRGVLDDFVGLLKRTGDSAFRWLRNNPKTVRRLGLVGAAVYLVKNPDVLTAGGKKLGQGVGVLARGVTEGVAESLGGGVWGTVGAYLVLGVPVVLAGAILVRLLPLGILLAPFRLLGRLFRRRAPHPSVE